MRIIFLKQARKELEHCPTDLITAKGLHELRLSKRSGEYRIFYVIKVGDAIYILHVTHKKTQKTDARTIHLIKTRLKELES